MKLDIKKVQLYKWLNSKDKASAARVLVIRDEVAKWLPQVARFFPHYPSHGLDHSDRIIEQLSRLLFAGNKPVTPLSSAEVYCLLCAAYLHDIGMVVSPGDAKTILVSEPWKAFVGTGGKGYESFQKYVATHNGSVLDNNEATEFLADQALRYLIAEFVRRDHHERAKTTLELHRFLQQLVDDGDSVAFETIGDIAVGHGLRDSELADDNRFPEERDVFDGKVNVRFMARLLRIGDLLDMSSKRADPMTARAVGPLPTNAEPHWQQYSAKKHENITPKLIEFTFECKDQDTHRVLRDWFGWLEAEVRAAGLEQLHSARHSGWKAPQCSVSSRANAVAHGASDKCTIVIKPAGTANYTFHDWKLELDHELVLNRLIHDVYDDPTVFVRELIQNALDATRCQIYADSAEEHRYVTLPERPTQFALEIRECYPIVISCTQEEVKLSPDGPTENRVVITIEDRGTGMNEEIIRRYFLQIGRSYYQSHEFRERFKFAPTSRFGIGFLSVFAVSNDITVDTARRDDDTGKIRGIRLRLREPRSYLLTEHWTPFEDRTTGTKNGTRVRVVLGDWPLEQPLSKLVRAWCVAVEIPVVVKDAAGETTIRSDRLIDKTILAVSRQSPDARFILRTFDIDSGDVEGQVAVIAYEDAAGEGWCDCWPSEQDLGGNRVDQLPELDNRYTALHGVRLGGEPVRTRSGYRDRQWIQRCDVRSSAATVPIARSGRVNRRKLGNRIRDDYGADAGAISFAASAVEMTVQVALERHLADSQRAKGARGVYYVGRVLSGAPAPDLWRENFPGTVVTWQNGMRVDLSVADLLALNEVIIAAWMSPYTASEEPLQKKKPHPREVSSAAPIVSWSDAPSFSIDRVRAMINGMNLIAAETRDDLWLLHFSAAQSGPGFFRVHANGNAWITPTNLVDRVSLGGRVAGLRCEFLGESSSRFFLFDQDHEVFQWLCQLREYSKNNADLVSPEYAETAWHCASNEWYKMSDLLARWATSTAIPAELKPPMTKEGRMVRYVVEELHSRATVARDST